MSIFDALNNNDINKLKELIKDKNNLNIKSEDGYTPLHLATSEEQIKLLIGAGADVNAIDVWGRSKLHWVDTIEELQFLLEHGADPNIIENNGCLPIQTCYMTDEMKQLLIQYGSKNC